ncbi:MAG: hypothetical protein PQJ46_04045 [Spirochaetales bacterium]|nr:hypothetical protein [Spirochaetales bacterium]
MIFTGISASAEMLYVEETGFIVELPIGWKVIDINESKWTFQDFTGNAFMQIKVFPGDTYKSSEEIFNEMTKKIQANADGDKFDFYGRDSVFSTLSFNSQGFDYSGYALFADGEDFDLAILSFASKDAAPLLNDYILSALDSFSVSTSLMNNPGPVSLYYQESYNGTNHQSTNTDFEGEKVDWKVDEYGIEASQLMIEREARILADFKPETDAGKEAWKRYYRMIYRDSYSRLDYLATVLEQKLKLNGKMDSAPERLLKWVQGFKYKRTQESASDLVSPLEAAAIQTGDCDTRVLLYTILLNHYGIDSAMMVSSEYSHAMAALDIEGDGARIPFGKKGLLVAETTDDVELGMVASSMADPAKWLIIPVMEKEPWK